MPYLGHRTVINIGRSEIGAHAGAIGSCARAIHLCTVVIHHCDRDTKRTAQQILISVLCLQGDSILVGLDEQSMNVEKESL